MDGILIVDKPAGMTSHDVVARVRKLARQRKIGHAGTLDPLATGVLVLGLGKATRLLEYLTGHDKRYLAAVMLGQTTTTYDAEGEVVRTYEGEWPSREAVEAALERFRGEIEQRPPLFSAIKQGGERLYEKARRGENVDVPPRRVIIHELHLLRYAPPLLELDVRCSKGTYIRSLAHDLGEALGTGAFLAALRRTASGPFTIEQAHTLPEIEAAARERRLDELLLPLGAGLETLPAVRLSPEEARRLAQGQFIRAHTPLDGMVRALLGDELVALVQYDEQRRAWRPVKVLVSEPNQRT
ncbi:tRNA pseudouridine55 synthase [Ardenticatena maritima]|uniref:tRNA pseudouridine synthase B n=1 Tax=Ardenticatena maritima TaxID=872965 RepID=A0A0M8K7C0_9CHLR|nr:tRNA pseudouridine(55) synthase TruB [Ardenticatena maritima]KPL88557.1 hypothetical protein SE16_07245 [Ardenticatena maritima]GAP63283.1 tRNA pseudouridine55 synthase [Ardenticatena maritima]